MTTLILVPGLLCDETVWRYQASKLNDIARVIIPDFSNAHDLDGLLSAILKGAPETFALAGHSMGGWLALEVMRRAPHRVSKLCLLNTTARSDSKEKAAARRHMIQLAENNAYAAIIERLLKIFVYQAAVAPDVKQMLVRNQANFIDQETAMLNREDCMAILKQIRCPTLVIHARQDGVFQLSDATLLSREIPQATLSIVEESGHMSPMEASIAVTRLMENWLQAKNESLK